MYRRDKARGLQLSWPEANWSIAPMLALLQLVWMGWLFAHPISLDSDDALNFAHGVVRFSVLEFSPHFPGYPGFIALARLVALVAPSPDAAVQWAALLGSAAIPPLGAWFGVRLWQQSRLLAPLWLALLALPLTPALALSGLSDGPALAAWLGALIALSYGRAAGSGLWLALMLALRPSYAPLLVLPMWLLCLPPAHWHLPRRALLRALWPIALVGGVCLAFIWQADGAAYFSEGMRFTSGHFTLWGNTASHHASRLLSWLSQANSQFSWLWPLLLWPLWRAACALPPPLRRALLAGWLVLLGWTLWGQNPDNARHLAPLALLSLILAAGAVRPLLLAAGALAGLLTTLSSPAPSPTAQALTLAEQYCPALVTNWGVRLARETTRLPVTDAWYAADAALAQAHGACRLTRTRPVGAAWKVSRLHSEPELWLQSPQATAASVTLQ